MDLKRRTRIIFQLEPLLPYAGYNQDIAPFVFSKSCCQPDKMKEPLTRSGLTSGQSQQAKHRSTGQKQSPSDLQTTVGFDDVPGKQGDGEEALAGSLPAFSPTKPRQDHAQLAQKRQEIRTAQASSPAETTIRPQALVDNDEDKISSGVDSWREEKIFAFPFVGKAKRKVSELSSSLDDKRSEGGGLQHIPELKNGGSQYFHEPDVKTNKTEKRQVESKPPELGTVVPESSRPGQRAVGKSSPFGKARNVQPFYWLDDFAKDLHAMEDKQGQVQKWGIPPAVEKWMDTPLEPEESYVGSAEIDIPVDQDGKAARMLQQGSAGQEGEALLGTRASVVQGASQRDGSRLHPLALPSGSKKSPRSRQKPQMITTPKSHSRPILTIEIGTLSIRQNSLADEVPTERQPLLSLQRKGRTAPGSLQRSAEKYILKFPIGLV